MPQIQTYNQQTNSPGAANIPNVQPVQNPDFVNQGIDKLGQGISSLGMATAQAGISQQLFDQQKAKQAAIINANGLDVQTQVQWNQHFIDLQNQASGAATGFTDNLMQNYNNYKTQTLNNISDPLLKQELSPKLDAYGKDLAIKSQNFQQKSYVGYQMDTANDWIKNSSILSAQSGGAYFPQYLQDMHNFVDTLPVPPEDKQKFINSSNKQVINSTADSILQNNPAQLNKDTGIALGKIKQNPTYQIIYDESIKQGVSPLMVLSLVGHESGGVMDAKNNTPGSTAYGPLQITDATWKDLGKSESDRQNPQAVIEATVQLASQRQNALQAYLGRAPTLGETEATIQFGQTGGQNIITADPNTPIEKFISPKTAANNNISGQTTGQVIANLNDKLNKQANNLFGAAPAYVQAMDTNQRIDWYNKSQAQLNKQNAAAKTILEQTANDQIAQTTQGIIPSNILSRDAFNSVYKDPTIADLKYNQYNDSIQLAKNTSQMPAMTAQQRAKTYQDMNPVPGTFGYDQQLKKQQIFGNAMQNFDKAMQSDPSNYFNNNDTNIKNLYNQWQQNSNDPTATRNYLVAQDNAQRQQGINIPQLLSSNDQANIVKQITGTQGLDTAKVVQNMSTQYGNYWPQIVSQMQNDKSLPTGISTIMTAPTADAADQASLIRNTSLQQLEKGLPSGTKTSEVNNSISNALQNWENSMSANELNSKYVADTQSTIQKIVYDKVRLNMDPDDAAQSTVNMFVGSDKYQFIKQNTGTLRVPKGANADLIDQASKDIVNTLGINDVYFGDVKALKNPWYLSDNADGYLSQIKNNSYWKTSSDNQSASLYFLGSDNRPYPVMDKSGKQISKTFLELQPTKPIMTYADSIFE